MKKIYIAIAVLATAALTSCEMEKSFGEITPVAENGIAFSIGNPATRSAGTVADAAAQTGISIPVQAKGESFYLEETIENLNPTLSTKGTPAYTVNVGTIYTTLGVYAASVGEAAFDRMDETMTDNKDSSLGQGWRYQHVYPGADPWPDETTPVDFYLNMPASPSGVTFTSRADKQTKFSYTSPATGAAQQDLLFGQTSISKTEHNDYLPFGAPVMMYHALTGVKFRNGHENNNPTKTIITKVEFTGLKSTGTCTVSPEATDIVVWDGLDDATSFTQTFTNQAWSAASGVDGTVSFNKETESPDDIHFGDSWYAVGTDTNNPTNTHNLNDTEGSLTFWFIPQAIDENVTLKVTFRVKTEDTPDGTEITQTINFGEQLAAKNVEWKAGELRTYTLKPRDVDVKIVDQMQGLTKSNLHVTNTGNVDEYVRILVIGNWYGWETQADKDAGKEPDIMVGYTTSGEESPRQDVMVDPWFREDPVYGQYFDDTFPMGRPAAGRTDWVRGTGSYFYYTEKIGPGSEVGTTDSGTNPLFKSYTLPADKIPTIYIPVTWSNVRVPAVGVHLKMEIVIQAIGTTKPDGTEYADCWEAWTAAIGKTITIK